MPSAKPRTQPIGTTMPVPRSTRAKATAMRNGSGAIRRGVGSAVPANGVSSAMTGLVVRPASPGAHSSLERLLDEVGDAMVANPLLVLAVLEDGAERGVDEVFVE